MKLLQSAFVVGLTACVLMSTGCARWRPFSNLPLPIQAQPQQNQLIPSAQQQAPPPTQLDPVQQALHTETPRPRFGSRLGILQSRHEVTAQPQGLLSQQQPQGHSQGQVTAQSFRKMDAALSMARLTERRGNPAEARQMYLDYLKNHPGNLVCLHRLAIMAAKETKYEESDRYFQLALNAGEPTTELLSDIGYCYFRQNRLEEAEHFLKLAIQKEPNNEAVNNNLGLVYGARGDFARSLHHFRQVVDEGEAHANLAFVQSQQGDLDKSRDSYLRALTADDSLRTAAEALVQVEKRRKEEVAVLEKKKEELTGEAAADKAPAEEVAATQLKETPAPTNHRAESVIELPDPDEKQPKQQAVVEQQEAPAEARQPKAEPIPVADSQPRQSANATAMFNVQSSGGEVRQAATAKPVPQQPQLTIRTIDAQPGAGNSLEQPAAAVRVNTLRSGGNALRPAATPVESTPKLRPAAPQSQTEMISPLRMQTTAPQAGQQAAPDNQPAWNVRLKQPAAQQQQQQSAQAAEFPRHPLANQRPQSLVPVATPRSPLTGQPEQLQQPEATPIPPTRAEVIAKQHQESVARMQELPTWSRHAMNNGGITTAVHQTPTMGHVSGTHQHNLTPVTPLPPMQPAASAQPATQVNESSPSQTGQQGAPVVTPEQLRAQMGSSGRASRLGSRLFQPLRGN